MRGGYQAAQNVETVESRAVITTAAMCRASDCPPVTTLSPDTPVLTDQLLTRQYMVLDGISAYADKLVSLTSPETQTLVSQSVGKVGASLKALSAETATVTNARALLIDNQTIDNGVRAIGALGDFLVQEKLNAELPKVIEENHPVIVNYANYLDATIGSPVDITDPGGKPVLAHGLRAILALKVAKIDQNSAVLINRLRKDQKFGSADLIDYTGKVYDSNLSRARQTDAALVEVQAALKKMVAAHAALKAPKDPTTSQQIQSFAAFVHRAAEAVNRAMGKS
ncbi:hypothetical protein TSO221_24250 [Azospirillum sp. TSO22-1]|nr:hypothetical protein TSO221_24250 [Azospirillum sp. TSO22-1]